MASGDDSETISCSVGYGSEEETVLAACLDELVKENDREIVRVALETMLKITNNVIQHPNDEKFRQIKTENKNFKSKVWCLPDAQQFLYVCGWIEADNIIQFKGDMNLSLIKNVLQNRLSSLTSTVSENKEQNPTSQKEKALNEERRLLREKAKLEKQEKERIKAQIRADRENIKSRQLRDSKAKVMQGDGRMTNFKDIGIDPGAGGGG